MSGSLLPVDGARPWQQAMFLAGGTITAAGFAGLAYHMRGAGGKELLPGFERKAKPGAVATQVWVEQRLQELVANIKVGASPSLDDFERLRGEVAKKANAEDAAMSTEVESRLLGKLESRFLDGAADTGAAIQASVRRLEARIRDEVEPAMLRTDDAVKALQQNVRASVQDTSRTAEGDVVDGNLKKVQLLVAAASARFEKQLAELRRQMEELRGSPVEAGERWPGRVLSGHATPSAGSRSATDGASENGAESVASLSTSPGGSVDKPEFAKMQAMVTSAGVALTRQLRELRKSFNDFKVEQQLEVKLLREQMSPSLSGPSKGG